MCLTLLAAECKGENFKSTNVVRRDCILWTAKEQRRVRRKKKKATVSKQTRERRKEGD